MLAKGVLVLLVTTSLLALGCSQATVEEAGAAEEAGEADGAEDAGDDALIVPAGLRVSALAGGNGVLELVALTLRKGASSHELYAALRNRGEVPACHAALSVELFDHADQSLAAGISGLLAQDFYRLSDGSGTVAACVAPGKSTMAALTDLPLDFALADVGTVVYRCPYFALEVEPGPGLALDGMKRVDGREGSVYTGSLVNELDVAVSRPSVTVFPLSRAGRPLGVATSTGTGELAPGERWAFETDPIAERGADFAAFPAGALAPDPSSKAVEP